MNKYKFVRFGKLGLVKQKGFGKDTFHSPPASKGFYAMPYEFQEFFLISSIKETQKNIINLPKIEKHKDEKGVISKEYTKKVKERYSAIRKEFVVKKTDILWHHLDVPNNEVIDRHNAWVKTTVSAWYKAVKKESIKLRAESLKSCVDTKGTKNFQPGGINSVRKRTGFFSKDHFEVFFDTKVF